MSNDPYEADEHGMPEGESCGTCMHCYRGHKSRSVVGDESPFDYAPELRYLGKQYGICVDMEDWPVVVGLGMRGDTCPCEGESWFPRKD